MQTLLASRKRSATKAWEVGTQAGVRRATGPEGSEIGPIARVHPEVSEPFTVMGSDGAYISFIPGDKCAPVPPLPSLRSICALCPAVVPCSPNMQAHALAAGPCQAGAHCKLQIWILQVMLHVFTATGASILFTVPSPAASCSQSIFKQYKFVHPVDLREVRFHLHSANPVRMLSR